MSQSIGRQRWASNFLLKIMLWGSGLGGCPRKWILRWQLVCTRFVQKHSRDQHLLGKGREQHWEDGEVRPQNSPSIASNDPPGSPAAEVALLIWDGEVGPLYPLTSYWLRAAPGRGHGLGQKGSFQWRQFPEGCQSMTSRWLDGSATQHP